ncbi:hypothetical protein ABZR86_14060 [Dyella marensis]|jgi:hypothetical protein|uniref:hypothetical protein n=1 Tax=Dyella TaxID=231454 RepID=UPI001160AF6A|nr:MULTISPECIES: hypothetical protein [Dyella]
MSELVKVMVQWAEEKKPAIPKNGRYSTVAKFDEDIAQWPREAWSIVLEFDPALATQGQTHEAMAHFLMPLGPQQRLKSGRTFELYEGLKRTAVVTVL